MEKETAETALPEQAEYSTVDWTAIAQVAILLAVLLGLISAL